MDRAGRWSEAVPLRQRILDIREHVLGRNHPDTLAALSGLGRLYVLQWRYAEAEPLYLRALKGREQLLGRDHRDTLNTVEALATLYHGQGRYAEAEPLYRRALEAHERVQGPDASDTLGSVCALAALYQDQGRFLEAEPLFVRAYETSERVRGRGRDDWDTFAFLTQLVDFYVQQGSEKAEPLLRRKAEASAVLMGRDAPDTLDVQAAIDLNARRYAGAEQLFRRAMVERERTRGTDNPDTITSVNNLAHLYQDQGRYADAEPLFRRVLDSRERMLGDGNPRTLRSFENALIASAENRPGAPDALDIARRFLAAHRERRQQGGGRQQAQAQLQREREGLASSGRFALFADIAWNATAAAPAQDVAVRQEAFAALQDSVAGLADRAIAQQAALRYAGERDGALIALVAERQRREDEWVQLDDQLGISYGAQGGGDPPALIRAQLETVQTRIDAIDARLRAEAPDYFNLIRPASLDVAAAQALMGPDDALLLVVPSRFGTHMVAVTHDDIVWRRSEWTARQVQAAVQQLRWDAGAQTEGTPAQIAAAEAADIADAPLSFDRNTAYELYRHVVEPVATAFAGKRRLFIAAGGSLASLPFALLVARPPQGADNDAAALRATTWFGDRYALIHIPSIRSLALLRQTNSVGFGRQGGFVGFGDPVLEGEARPRNRGASRDAPDPRRIFRGGATRTGGAIANVADLRNLARLPGTAIELEAVRRELRAPVASLHLAARATEPAVRTADLSHIRLLLFSTHGLTQANGVGEGGLVLTPPDDEGSETDDGYLAASEVAALRLNADWVILSACNSATGEESEGLGGLARAFFYAGARNLLASHWPVDDEVAPVLITRTLALERAGRPRAEAFQQAMREIRDGRPARPSQPARPSPPEWAHPFYWAPFVLIGS